VPRPAWRCAVRVSRPARESCDIVRPSFRGWVARGSYPLGNACQT
jgi:hypothetical protein